MTKSVEKVVAETVAAPEIKAEPVTFTLATTKPDDEIRAEAATAERDRIRECQAVFGYADASDATKALAFDGTSNEGNVAMAILADAQTKGKDHLANLAKAEAEMTKAGLTATPVAATPDPKPAPATTPDGWKAEYEASDEIRAEYISAETYASYKAAKAGGRIQELHS